MSACSEACAERNHPDSEHTWWRRVAESPTGQLHDLVWCTTCSHSHIPGIPTVTYACETCGFGAWGDDTAEQHATAHPEHIVYGRHHQTVPICSGPRSEPMLGRRLQEAKTRFDPAEFGVEDSESFGSGWVAALKYVEEGWKP